MSDLHAASNAIHDALPPGWRVTRPTSDYVTGGWTVTAIGEFALAKQQLLTG